MWKCLVKIFVELFIPKKDRLKVKMRLLNYKDKGRILRSAKSVGKNFVCVKSVYLNKYTTIGDNVMIGGICIVGCGDLNIGNNVKMAHEILFITDSHEYNGDVLPFDDTKTTGKSGILIEDNVWIGPRVTFLPGTLVREGAIVQAGSVVHGEIPKGAIVGGNPATIIKYRDLDNYERVKAEGSFQG